METWLTTANKLLLRKMAVAGVVSFLSVFIPSMLTALDEIEGGGEHSFSTKFWISLLAGAVGAGLRGALAFLPWNLTPTDALHSVGGSSVTEVTVDTTGGSTPPPPTPPPTTS